MKSQEVLKRFKIHTEINMSVCSDIHRNQVYKIPTKKIRHSTISYSAYFQIKGSNAAEDKNEIALYKYIVFFA